MRAPVIALLMLWSAALASGVTQESTSRAIRGMATEVQVDYPARLRPRADQTPLSPVLVRVNPIEGSSKQRIEFVGNVVGDYDLRDYLEREDGKPLSDLPPLPVTVVSQLPPNHGTDLYSSGTTWFDWSAHYRLLLWLAVGVWVALPAAWLIYRATRKKPEAAPLPTAPAPPTLEDQLRAALSAAAARTLSTQEKAQLELLVFRFFSERLNRPFLGTTDDMSETLRAIRLNPETRELVNAIERWLHAYCSGEEDRRKAGEALEDFRRSRLSQPPATHAPTSATPAAGGTSDGAQEKTGRRPVPREDQGPVPKGSGGGA